MDTPIVSRGPMGLAAAVLAGGVSVALLATALAHADTMLVYLGCLSVLPLYVAGLGAGALAGVVAPIFGSSMLFAIMPVEVGMMYAFYCAIPSIVLIIMALRHRAREDGQIAWYSESKLLALITLYPCVLFLCAVAAYWHHPGGLLDITQQAFAIEGAQFAKQFGADDAEMFRRMISVGATIAPSIAAYSWIFVTALSMAGAQHVLAKQNWNLRPMFSLTSLNVPASFIYAVAATGLMAVLAPAPYNYIGRNLALILGLPLFFTGLAIVQAFAESTKHAGLFLLGFYVVLGCLPVTALLIAGLGVIDQWVNFRQRLVRKSTV